jgi:hypothetical protein
MWIFSIGTTVMIFPALMVFYIIVQCDDGNGIVKYTEIECWGLLHVIYLGAAALFTGFNFLFAIWWSRVGYAYGKYQFTVRTVPWFQHFRLAANIVLVASYYVTQKHASPLYPMVAPPLLSLLLAVIVGRSQPNYGNIKIKAKKYGGVEAHMMNSLMLSWYTTIFMYGAAIAVNCLFYPLSFTYIAMGTGGVFVLMIVFNLCLGSNAGRDRKRLTKIMRSIKKYFKKKKWDKVLNLISSLDDNNELNSIDDLMLRSETSEENTLIVVQEYMDVLLTLLNCEHEETTVQIISTFGIAARIGMIKENAEINEITANLPYENIIKVVVPLLKEGTSSNSVKAKRRIINAFKAKMALQQEKTATASHGKGAGKEDEELDPDDLDVSIGSMSTMTRSTTSMKGRSLKSPTTRKGTTTGGKQGWQEEKTPVKKKPALKRKKITWEKEILGFYKKHSPEKASKDHVVKLLEINKGREYEMAARLYSKYDLPVPKKFLPPPHEYDEDVPKKRGCCKKCCSCFCRFFCCCCFKRCCCCCKRSSQSKYEVSGDAVTPFQSDGAKDEDPSEKIDVTQNLQILTAYALAYIAEAHEEMSKKISTVSIVNSLIIHSGEHQPTKLRAACVRCLSVLSHQNRNVQKMVSTKGTSINTIVAMCWHKDPTISIHALQIMGNAGLPFRDAWKSADAMGAALGVFLLEYADSNKKRTERLAATLHAIARLTQNDVDAQNLFLQKGALKDIAELYKRHVKDPPDVVISLIPYVLVGLTSSPALAGDIFASDLLNLMIEGFMMAAFDGVLPMDLIARAAGGGKMAFSETSIITMKHRKSLLENYSTNIERALSQVCDARQTVKLKATMILSKVVQSAKNPYKKLRAEDLMSRVIHYVAPEQEWQKKKKASKRKVAVPKQKVKRAVELIKTVEEEVVKSCFCFGKKKNTREEEDNAVIALEEGALGNSKGRRGKGSATPSRLRNSQTRSLTRASTAKAPLNASTTGRALKTSPKRSSRKTGKVSPR